MSGGTRSYEMARRMVKAGHEVHMVTSCTEATDGNTGWYVEVIEGITVHWLPVEYSNSMGFGRRLWSFFQFATSAGRYAAKLGGDVVFATSTPLTIAIPAVQVSRKLQAPMVFEVRDLWPELPIAMGALKFPFAKTVAHKLERWAYKNASRVVGLSPGMCEGVIKTGYPETQTLCIPNSADVELFSVDKERGLNFRRSREWLGDRKLVVYAGTFGRINGVGYLAEIAHEMRSLDPDVRFLVVGGGAEFELVCEKAEGLGVLGRNFFMEGPLPKKDMPALLSAATVCTSLFIPLQPMWHNSANKFFDALAAGKPVMINYGGWQKDLLESYNAGISVSAESPREAAVHLKAFLNDDSRLASAGARASELAHTKFARDTLAQRLIETLESVVAGG
ncbi:glycosyltransferase family 4 protein [Marinobacter sp. F4216]|nr:glycosyltransferase family 4 protein [Marinobacter sp. F4216]